MMDGIEYDNDAWYLNMHAKNVLYVYIRVKLMFFENRSNIYQMGIVK